MNQAKVIILVACIVLVGSSSLAGEKSITYFDTHFQAVYGQTALCRYIAGSYDTNGDGTVNWSTYARPEESDLNWVTIEETDGTGYGNDPGNSVLDLELSRPAPINGDRALVWIFVYLRTLPLEVDRLYTFNVNNVNERDGMAGTAERLNMDFFVLPCAISGLELSLLNGMETDCVMQWGDVDCGNVEIASFSVYRGVGIPIDAQNLQAGSLAVEGLGPNTRTYVDHPPLEGVGNESNYYIYTVFGHDSNGKIVARSDQVTFIEGPVNNEIRGWGDIKSMFR